jgi:hypothetical protein
MQHSETKYTGRAISASMGYVTVREAEKIEEQGEAARF